MKKVIMILLVGLFWCSTSFAESSLPECEGNDKNISKYSKKHFKIMKKWSNCHGTAMGPKGQIYIGEFRKGKFHGQGIFRHEGREYVGQYQKHKRHGQGTYAYADGSKYVGGWKKGKKYGVGTLTEADGTVEKLIDGKTFISYEEKAKAKEEAKEDKQIAKAQSVCKKIGFTPGTDKFADCTIKMLTTTKSTNQGQGQTIIVGPPRKYPKVACDAMGGLVC